MHSCLLAPLINLLYLLVPPTCSVGALFDRSIGCEIHHASGLQLQYLEFLSPGASSHCLGKKPEQSQQPKELSWGSDELGTAGMLEVGVGTIVSNLAFRCCYVIFDVYYTFCFLFWRFAHQPSPSGINHLTSFRF